MARAPRPSSWSDDHSPKHGRQDPARFGGFANAFEACTPGAPFGGHAIRSAIGQSLRSAKIEAADVAHVNAHGLSTVEHDRAEALAIRDTLGDVPVTAPKSYFGNLGAGTGAVELLATLMAFETGQIPVTLNYERPDPMCPVNVVHGQPHASNGGAAVVLNQTSMGQSVAMVLFPPGSYARFDDQRRKLILAGGHVG